MKEICPGFCFPRNDLKCKLHIKYSSCVREYFIHVPCPHYNLNNYLKEARVQCENLNRHGYAVGSTRGILNICSFAVKATSTTHIFVDCITYFSYVYHYNPHSLKYSGSDLRSTLELPSRESLV